MATPSLTSSLHPKAGFHTTSTTAILISNPASFARCSLHLYYALSPYFFVDQYELANYKEMYTFKHWGTSNLELPVAAVSHAGSAVLLNVTWSNKVPGSTNVTVAVPLHARYGEITESDTFRDIIVDWPVAFFACPSSLSASPTTTPFVPSLRPEFMSYFDPTATKFVEIPPTSMTAHDTIRLPIGNLSHLVTVQLGTTLCIICLFFYLLHASYTTWKRFKPIPRSKDE